MLIEEIKSTPRRDGVAEILVPSERAFRQRRVQTAAGFLDIDAPLHDALQEWASGRNALRR